MSLIARIAKVSQDHDIDSGAFENSLILELPGGVMVRAVVNDKAVELVMALVADGASGKPSTLPENDARTTVTMDATDAFREELMHGQPAMVFGGDAPAQETPEPGPDPITPPRQNYSRTVPKDEMGYPVVTAVGVDAGEVLGGPEEEDGVAQL